jgi:sporulation protein YlmC with PRC-barrel domain
VTNDEWPQPPRGEPHGSIEPSVLDNLRQGATVVTADGKHVGTLHAVVIDARDDDITHLAVNAGPHFPAPGFGAPHIVSVPIEEMADAREAKVILKCTKHKFTDFPDYAEWNFGRPTDAWNPPEGLQRDTTVATMESIRQGAGLWSMPVPAEVRHRQPFEREIPHGAFVWRVEGGSEEEIGAVDRVLSEEVTEHIRALVIHEGHFFGHDVILPIEYVTDINDTVVHVQMTDADLAALEPFVAPPEP